MIVVGAGMAGLLAACMLRSECSGVLEKQPTLPLNHHALLRFRTSVVGDVLGIPFKKVQVMKAIQPWTNPVADALAYSVKSTGVATLRSSISAQGEVEERYVAPENLTELMAARCREIQFSSLPLWRNLSVPVISTIPMPVLMKILGWTGRFPCFPNYAMGGSVVRVKLDDVDAYATVYEPDPLVSFSRVSITGDTLIIECPGKAMGKLKLDYLVKTALARFGLDPFHIGGEPETVWQERMKILPIDEGVRKQFIMWATDEFNVFSLGRFATWRPGLLLDDVVKDVRAIQKLADSLHGTYSHRLGGNS